MKQYQHPDPRVTQRKRLVDWELVQAVDQLRATDEEKAAMKRQIEEGNTNTIFAVRGILKMKARGL